VVRFAADPDVDLRTALARPRLDRRPLRVGTAAVAPLQPPPRGGAKIRPLDPFLHQAPEGVPRAVTLTPA